MELKHKTIVITGGTSGVGLELVKKLQPSNRVIVISRSKAKLDVLEKTYPTILTYQADLAKLNQVKSVAQLINEKLSSIDVLINNAALQYTPIISSENFSLEQAQEEANLNLLAPLALSHLFVESMLKAKQRAIIININSGLALSPKTTSAMYCASKAGLHSLSLSLAYQLANTNIKVLQAFLPLVDTKMTAGRGTGKLSPEKVALEIIKGIEREKPENNIGKVKLLRILLAFAPTLAKNIMRRW